VAVPIKRGLLRESEQYSARSIRRYERIFGADFLSSGGAEITKRICETLGIRAGMRVLDVGSGLGGSAFLMRGLYGAVVTGVDVLPQMVSMATERAAKHGLDGIHFVEGDILELALPEASFDLVYSRDAFLYIKDKLALFRTLYRLVAPQGRLFVSDYACGAGPLSKEFIEYSREAGYHLEPPAAYGAAIEEAGFGGVEVRDMTATFVDILRGELAGIRECGGGSEDDLDPADRDYLIERWERKIRWCKNKEMRWAHFHAVRS